jgi:Cu+-exporting ATPase
MFKDKDRVCGMGIENDSPAAMREYKGETFCFCSPSCVRSCDVDRARDFWPTSTKKHNKPEANRGHNQCHQVHCPLHSIDGDVAAPETDREARDAKFTVTKFWLGLILTIRVLFLTLGKVFPGLSIDTLVPVGINKWIQLILATAIVFWCGGIFFVRAWRSIVNRSLNVFTLIGVGVGAAYLYNAVANLLPSILPESFKHHREIDLYFEPAAVITVLVLLCHDKSFGSRKARTVNAVALVSLFFLALFVWPGLMMWAVIVFIGFLNREIQTNQVRKLGEVAVQKNRGREF